MHRTDLKRKAESKSNDTQQTKSSRLDSLTPADLPLLGEPIRNPPLALAKAELLVTESFMLETAKNNKKQDFYSPCLQKVISLPETNQYYLNVLSLLTSHAVNPIELCSAVTRLKHHSCLEGYNIINKERMAFDIPCYLYYFLPLHISNPDMIEALIQSEVKRKLSFTSYKKAYKEYYAQLKYLMESKLEEGCGEIEQQCEVLPSDISEFAFTNAILLNAEVKYYDKHGNPYRLPLIHHLTTSISLQELFNALLYLKKNKSCLQAFLPYFTPMQDIKIIDQFIQHGAKLHIGWAYLIAEMLTTAKPGQDSQLPQEELLEYLAPYFRFFCGGTVKQVIRHHLELFKKSGETDHLYVLAFIMANTPEEITCDMYHEDDEFNVISWFDLDREISESDADGANKIKYDNYFLKLKEKAKNRNNTEKHAEAKDAESQTNPFKKLPQEVLENIYPFLVPGSHFASLKPHLQKDLFSLFKTDQFLNQSVECFLDRNRKRSFRHLEPISHRELALTQAKLLHAEILMMQIESKSLILSKYIDEKNYSPKTYYEETMMALTAHVMPEELLTALLSLRPGIPSQRYPSIDPSRDGIYQTYLHYFSAVPNLKLIQLLIDKGDRIDLPNSKRYSPLFYILAHPRENNGRVNFLPQDLLDYLLPHLTHLYNKDRKDWQRISEHYYKLLRKSKEKSSDCLSMLAAILASKPETYKDNKRFNEYLDSLRSKLQHMEKYNPEYPDVLKSFDDYYADQLKARADNAEKSSCSFLPGLIS